MHDKNKGWDQASPKAQKDSLFLPNFCSVHAVFAVVVGGQLLAFLLVLARADRSTSPWEDLGLVSLFVQWIGLATALLLCLARPVLGRLGNAGAGLVGYGAVLVITLLLSEAAYRIMGDANSLGGEPLAGWHWEFLARNLSISAVVSAVTLRYLYVQHQWRRNVETEARARFQALQARIRPHFLFNSMNTIASLVRSRPDLAEAAVEDLADLFRAALGDGREQVTLAEELEFTRRYLNIEKLRLGERLTVVWAVDALPMDVTLPALTLQPLLENAVYHGIGSLSDGGTLGISGQFENGLLSLTVSNPVATEADAAPRAGNRLALENIRQRLEALYGHRGRLDMQYSETQFHVTVSIPCGKRLA